MSHRRVPLCSPPYGADQRVAEIASPPSRRLEETNLKTPLQALARLLGAQAAREALKAGAVVPTPESTGGADE